MSKMTAEIREVYADNVVNGLIFSEDSPVSKRNRQLLSRAALSAAECAAANSGNYTVEGATSWFLARFALDPMFSGITQRDSQGFHESAVLATVDILKERGHSVGVFDVLNALKPLREMRFASV